MWNLVGYLIITHTSNFFFISYRPEFGLLVTHLDIGNKISPLSSRMHVCLVIFVINMGQFCQYRVQNIMFEIFFVKYRTYNFLKISKKELKRSYWLRELTWWRWNNILNCFMKLNKKNERLPTGKRVIEAS